jgi:cell division protein FtsL
MKTASVNSQWQASSGNRIGLWLAVLALWLAVVGSAIAVVIKTHEARKLNNQLASLRAESAQLQVQHGQFQLERSTWAAYSRIETLAADELNMVPPDTEQIVVVAQ